MKKEDYPYITYNFISPYTPFNGMGNYRNKNTNTGVEETLELQAQATISINVYSNNREDNGHDGKMETLELAHDVRSWFKHTGWQYLSDANITVVNVEAFGDRGTVIVDSNEHRVGMDIIIRFTDEIVRDYDNIEEFNIDI